MEGDPDSCATANKPRARQICLPPRSAVLFTACSFHVERIDHNTLPAAHISSLFGLVILTHWTYTVQHVWFLCHQLAFSLSRSLALSPPLPPQFPLHLTGQGIAAHLTQGGLAQVFFAPPAAYVDKIRLSLTLPTISCFITMSRKRAQFPAFFFISVSRLNTLLHNTGNCCIFISVSSVQ